MGGRDHGVKAVSWWNSTPLVGPTGTAATWVGIQFGIEVPGRIAGMRFYVDMTEDGNYPVMIWEPNTFIGRVNYRARVRVTTGNQWQQVWFRPYLRIQLGTLYRMAVVYPHGKFYRNNTALAAPVRRNNITFENGFQTTAIEPIGATITLNTNANAIDVLFYPD